VRIKLIYPFFFLFIAFSLRAQTYTEPLKKKLDSLLQFVNDEHPGGYIHIEQGNQLLYNRGFGLSDLESGSKFTENTLINIGSLSKTFIAYSILKLEEQGSLKLEDSIYKYIPEFKNKTLAQKIKIRDLLMHTSGLKDLPVSPMDSVYSLTMNDAQNFELVKYTNTPSFEPGSNFLYADEAFSALVLILEKVSKSSWQEYLQKNIMAPIGMTFSKLTYTSEVTSAAHGYISSAKGFTEFDQGECPKMYTATNAGIWSNIIDLRKYLYGLKYCLFVNCDNVAISEKMIRTNAWYSTENPPHNYVWFVSTDQNANRSIYYKSKIGGFVSHVIFYPEKDLSLIYLSNNSTDLTPEIHTILKQFLKIK
jgi:CubicO group peptidase (beta-lactamase class C family)